MSAYLSSADALSALATYWGESVRRDRFGDPQSELTRALYRSGFPWHDATARAQSLLTGRLPETVIFELLLSENVASLEERYAKHEALSDMTDHEGYAYRRDPDVISWMTRRESGRIVGILRGYEYQACEHRGWETSIGKAICDQISRSLLKDLERRDTPSDDQDRCTYWASYERPSVSLK